MQIDANLSVFIYLFQEVFRDKLTPITVSLNYSLDESHTSGNLKPIINYYSETFLQKVVRTNIYYLVQSIVRCIVGHI